MACEPTGHRWKSLAGLAGAAGHGFVCVQPMAVHRARETDDYTLGKTDHRDAYLIGKLVTRLECYLPEQADETWARLRHLGARRFALVADLTAARQQSADLLGCAWPAALGTAENPLEAVTWMAAMAVITQRCAGRPERLWRMGYDRFLAAVRREMPRWGGKMARRSIVKGLWDALDDRGGVAAQRPGAVERLQLLMEDWRDLRRKLGEIRRQGWAGSARTVRRYLAQFHEPGTVHEAPPAVPKARQITRLLLTRPDHLDTAERKHLAQIRAACPYIDALAGHVTSFAEMMASLTGATHLDSWLDAVEAADGQPELRSFANGIRHDKEAVLKAVKRQMFGRASFALLRKRMILHPA